VTIVDGQSNLQRLDPGGADVFEIDGPTFFEVLNSENHTLKRALTDPKLLSGIGNAYSDEILWEAQLSPIAMTRKLSQNEVEGLFAATRSTLTKWVSRLRAEARLESQGFPEKVTAFRADMAVHGRYGQPCPRCGSKIQRIRYASNETNYCAKCQTGGRLLADRALSRLLRSDWPRTIEELEKL
jgi:formamidopyrimidine-DNA glycosylase